MRNTSIRKLLCAVTVVAAGTTGYGSAAGAEVGEKFRDCPNCPEMVVVPSGNYEMGSQMWESGRFVNEGPAHLVAISEPFAVGIHEVTRGEWSAFVAAAGYSAEDSCAGYEGGKWATRLGRNWRDPGFAQADDHPVVCVSWKDAKAYVGWLSRETGAEYRLLSEAEWEYVARSGSRTTRYWGDSEDGQCRHANGADRKLRRRYREWAWPTASCDDGHAHTAAAGSFAANGFGLHDVAGNVWEWVEDCWQENYWRAPSDGSAWTTGDFCGLRGARGGSWLDIPRVFRSALRAQQSIAHRSGALGFRVARNLN